MADVLLYRPARIEKYQHNYTACCADPAAKTAYDAAVATIQTTSCGAAGFNQVQGPGHQNGGAAAAASATSGGQTLENDAEDLVEAGDPSNTLLYGWSCCVHLIESRLLVLIKQLLARPC